jgi:hypothetical protein
MKNWNWGNIVFGSLFVLLAVYLFMTTERTVKYSDTTHIKLVDAWDVEINWTVKYMEEISIPTKEKNQHKRLINNGIHYFMNKYVVNNQLKVEMLTSKDVDKRKLEIREYLKSNMDIEDISITNTSFLSPEIEKRLTQ